MADARLRAVVSGAVQGVGFRVWMRHRARGLALVGFVRNLPDGRVDVIAEGGEAACRQLLTAIWGDEGPGRVSDVEASWATPTGDFAEFRIGE